MSLSETLKYFTNAERSPAVASEYLFSIFQIRVGLMPVSVARSS